ncbi:MAG: tRNA 5-methoxyuridine(34)/uridine 5-oxyacetic acid(34) synthase CmoB [Pseudomonadales bacterium]|nr:tRNA 5-methoxyuridine(34)/uridine 5-oxyacetic acid(34) synthase CmoB [Pseudomonadales bacterium]
MINFDSFFTAISETPLSRWTPAFKDSLQQHFHNKQHGDLKKWLAHIEQFPQVIAKTTDFSQASIQIGEPGSLSSRQKTKLGDQLKLFKPWRKGPFDFFGIDIDTEWRSDLKWDRLLSHISPLKDRVVLDVGCGSGYHCWRMLGEDASLVIGIDPSQFFMMQYLTVRHFLADSSFYFLPLTMDQLPQPMKSFDTVFSMGVLYHRRSPIDHIMELRHSLRSGGELVLETLIVDGEEGYSFMPESTYGKMRNVWFIPTTDTLCTWLKRCGFLSTKVVDVSATTIEEQRKTEWIGGQSLSDFLDPNDDTKTIEGHPAPKRAVVVATAP